MPSFSSKNEGSVEKVEKLWHVLKLINNILIGQCKCKENSVLSSSTQVTFGYFKENSRENTLEDETVWTKQ